MSVSVVVPLGPGDDVRVRNWQWLARRLDALHPGWQVSVGACHDPMAWSKGEAVASAMREATGDVLVFMDADVFVPPRQLNEAIELAPTVPWVVPHETVHRLTPLDTTALVSGPPVEELAQIPAKLARRAHRGVAGGGIAVMSRETYEAVGPPDPRFVGWGGEDTSWRRALDTLVGSHVRLDADMVHLWHPPQLDQQNPSVAAKRLARRYKAAWHRPDTMRSLVEEARP